MVQHVKAKDPREAALEADAAARFGGTLHARKAIKMPRKAGVYIIASAQNNTHVHKELWTNLMALARYRDARVFMTQFTYAKHQYGDKAVKPGSQKASDYDDLWYADEILPYVCNDRVELAKNLVFCGELNILPTASDPLAGFENYSGRASAIIGHTRQEMRSIASLKAAKFNWTTGCVTLRNYLEKRAGQKASHYHAYGFLIVEVTGDGSWFVRQVRATEDGTFQDLDTIVCKGKVTTGHRVEAISWGDVHVDQLDPVVRQTNWGVGGIMDTLRPRYQFLHDTLDFRSRNHHDSKNPHEQFRKFVAREDDVEAEIKRVADFLRLVAWRDWCKTVVVDSNHDSALTRWLRDSDFRHDPANAAFYLRAQKLIYEAICEGREDYNLLAHLLRHMGVPRDVKFLGVDESFVILRRTGGIECGVHGHAGINGARGSPRQFAKLGRRVTTGHTHSAGIIGDVFTGGVSGKLRMNYNVGPSSWSQSHVLHYSNGSRAIITLWNGRWRG